MEMPNIDIQSLIQVVSVFIANAGLIIWFRSESRSDWRHMDNKVDSLRIETDNKIQALRIETGAILKAIHEEIKDFHAKLCVIAERNKK